VALKIDDGTSAAAEVTILALLRYLNALHPDKLEPLEERIRVPITNTRRVLTGYREAGKW
jgi:L-asparaginase II